MQEFSLTFILISGVLTALAITGIWSKDRIEFFGTGKKGPKVKFRDYDNNDSIIYNDINRNKICF